MPPNAMARILGIGGLDHNGSLTLLEHGCVVAFLELERPTRRKNLGVDDQDAMALALDRLGVDHVDHVALVDHTFVPLRPWLRPWLQRRFPGSSNSLHEHHACHLAAAFYASGWPSSTVLSLDGKGDGLSAAGGRASRERGLQIDLRVPSAHSLGRLWWAASVCCGLGDHHAAGKTMAFAALGRPTLLPALLECLTWDEGFRLAHPDDPDRFRRVPELAAWLAELDPGPVPTEGPRHPDVAASVQAFSEHVVARLAATLVARTGERRLALAGGVALNGLANQRLLVDRVADAVFVPPFPDDRGLSFGAAALAAALRGEPLRVSEGGLSPYLGPAPHHGPLEPPPGLAPVRDPDLVRAAARSLAAGQILAWFEGRDEAGPRALGNRSILASPVHTTTRERLNETIKRREAFRPFGCSLPLAAAPAWLDMTGPSPYMLRIVPVLTHRREQIPAVVHADGTTRPHTVTAAEHPRLAALITALVELGHPPVLLNTSLNRRGEPIAHTAAQALAIAADTGLDGAVIGDQRFVRRCLLGSADEP